MNDIKKQIDYWKDSSKRDLETALVLYKGKRYDSCLFFCHLVLEKMLKGLVLESTKEPAPYIHDLTKLANIANINFGNEDIENLKVINQFNIASRYDNVKQQFYKQCTAEYAKKYLSITKYIYLWLEKKFPKK